MLTGRSCMSYTYGGRVQKQPASSTGRCRDDHFRGRARGGGLHRLALLSTFAFRNQGVGDRSFHRRNLWSTVNYHFEIESSNFFLCKTFRIRIHSFVSSCGVFVQSTARGSCKLKSKRPTWTSDVCLTIELLLVQNQGILTQEVST